jgi:hypothetical protein
MLFIIFCHAFHLHKGNMYWNKIYKMALGINSFLRFEKFGFTHQS